MVTGVVGVVIWTEDLERLLGFYGDTLGLEPYSRHGDFVSFRWGRMRLGIGVHECVKGRSGDPYRIMVNLGTNEIHRLTARLKAKGVKFLREPEKEHWGGLVATFHDPDGNIVQLLQQPPERQDMG